MCEEEEEFMAIFGGDPADPEYRPLTEEEMAEFREELELGH